jgi:SAM-dependent methyltransferase
MSVRFGILARRFLGYTSKTVNMPTSSAEKLLGLLRESLASTTLVKLTLGAYRGSEKGLENVFIRAVRLKAGDRLQFVYRYTTRDVTKNLSAKEALRRLAEYLEKDFGSAHLFTTEFSAQWKRGSRRLLTGPSRHETPPAPVHDRPKQRAIAPGTGWLRALEAKPDKLRQIQKFLEILSHLIDLPKPVLRLVDMGCGKGYLTFAAYDWLRQNGWPDAEATGIERRTDLVEQSDRIARQFNLTGLHFEAADIERYLPAEDVYVLIALHACDTATDDAITKGIQAGAKVIIVAPCCHKELSPQLRAPVVLAGALRHGILHEREAEFVTDALRAALLEWQGYTTKVFEFISTEHTAKNLMITAVKHGRPGNLQPVKNLAAFYGIRSQRLAERLGLRFAT